MAKKKTKEGGWAKAHALAQPSIVVIAATIGVVQVAQIWAPEITGHTATLVACVALSIWTTRRYFKLKETTDRLSSQVRETEIRLGAERATYEELKQMWVATAALKTSPSQRRDRDNEDAPVFSLESRESI